VDEEPVVKQKLVTIYLENMAYAKGKMLVGSFADKHGFVEEHLQSYLDDGWRIGSVSGFGGNAESVAARGWLAVVLEK
jgi:hypothetical protein